MAAKDSLNSYLVHQRIIGTEEEGENMENYLRIFRELIFRFINFWGFFSSLHTPLPPTAVPPAAEPPAVVTNSSEGPLFEREFMQMVVTAGCVVDMRIFRLPLWSSSSSYSSTKERSRASEELKMTSESGHGRDHKIRKSSRWFFLFHCVALGPQNSIASKESVHNVTVLWVFLTI